MSFAKKREFPVLSEKEPVKHLALRKRGKHREPGLCPGQVLTCVFLVIIH